MQFRLTQSGSAARKQQPRATSECQRRHDNWRRWLGTRHPAVAPAPPLTVPNA